MLGTAFVVGISAVAIGLGVVFMSARAGGDKRKGRDGGDGGVSGSADSGSVDCGTSDGGGCDGGGGGGGD